MAVATAEAKTLRGVNHAAKKMLTEDLTYQLKGSPLKVDRDKWTIYDVKILGWNSKNKNRRYTPNGVNPALYEGAVVNIDHPDSDEAARGPRSLADRFGEVTGIYKNADGLFAKELHYNPAHTLCEQILHWAEHAPHLFGCSQNAFGDVYEDGTGEIVETVTEVRSIDLVSEPATTKGLYEAVDDDDEDGKGSPPPADDDGDADDAEIPLGGPSPDDEPAPPAPTGEGDLDTSIDSDMNTDNDADDVAGDMGIGNGGIDITDETLSQFRKIIESGMDPKMMKKKLGQLIAHHTAMQEGVMSAKLLKKLKTVDDAKKFLLESTDPVVRKAGKAVVGTLDRHEAAAATKTRRELAESLCTKASLPKTAITPFFLSTLIELRNEKEMMEAIEDRRQIVGTAKNTKPRSAGQGHEEGTAPGKALTEAEQVEAQKKKEAEFLADVFKA